MANRFLNNVKINDAYVLPPSVGTTGQYIKLTDAATGTTAWSDLGQAAEVSTISYEVRNETGSSIPIGSVVYVNGGSGSSDHVTIALSDASSESTSSKTFAVTAETIANNSTGKVILEGLVEGIDTSLFSPGDTLWLSTTAGEFENTIPATPDHAVFIGYAVRCQQNNGSIFVKIQNGYELGEIHDVKITTVADNEVIRYDSTLGYWVNANLNDTYYTETEADAKFVDVAGDTMTGGLEATSFTKTGGTSSQFLKADGSVDSNTYLISETDPVFSASPAAGISGTDITNWNTAHGWGDHSTQGYLTSESDTLDDVTTRSASTSNSVTVGGLHVNSTGAVEMPAGITSQRPVGVAGMFRFNSETSQFEGYNGTEWGAIAGSGGGTSGQGLSIERDVFTATANQTAFVISSAITASSNTQVYIDGVYQSKDNYTTNGSTVTFSTGVPAGAEVEVVHFISVFSKIYTDTFTGDNTTVDFTASKDVTDENVTQVYIDGVYQSKDNYTTSGTTITFSTAPPNGSAIEVVHFTALDYSTIASNQFTGTGSQTDFTLTQEVDVDKAFVFIQGVYQEKSTYSITGTTLSFTTAPLSGYTIEVITIGAVSVFSDTLYVDTFTGTGSQVDYTLSTAPASVNAIDVYLNGLYQNKSTFSLSGSTLTFSTAPTNGTAIEVKSTGGLNNVVSSAGGGISWQAIPKTANFTAVAGQGYFVNTTSGGVTVTLPSSPSAGDELTIVDYAGTADTNNITITSSDNINGAADDVIINYERGGVSMVYVDATQGWIAYNAANETATALNAIPLTVDYLVVAGGGAGGGGATNGFGGGGGGAGGLRTSYGSSSGGGASAESSLNLFVLTNYTVTVGSGGTGSSNSPGTSGSNSVFSTITSNGGGYGGNQNTDGNSGGSGGGSGVGGSGGSGTSSQGYSGGNGAAFAGLNNPGGGGGASQVGEAGSAYSSVQSSITGSGGGDGLSVSITGTATYYAGGGAGGTTWHNDQADGGLGGGANAPTSGNNGNNGTANTGGGGSGCSGSNGGGPFSGGAGGSGVVILRYPNTYTVTIGSGLTGSTATDGSDKVTTFTAGTGTISFS